MSGMQGGLSARDSSFGRGALLRAALAWACVPIAFVACGAESAPGEPHDAAGASSQDTLRGSDATGQAASADGCVCYQDDQRKPCKNNDGTLIDTQAWCALSSEGCPETLDVWRRCSRLGVLGSPGREGYLLTECEGGLTAVYYNYGFSDDTYWLYDAAETW
jgi:hypothetical protein